MERWWPRSEDAPAIDPKEPTAVFVVGSCRSGGIYALDWVRREFPYHFRNFIFMNVRTVDAVSFGGPEALESVRRDADKTLDYFVNFCNNRGLAAQAYLSFGTDPIQELTKLSESIRSEFPHSIFFTSKLIFDTTTGTFDNFTAKLR